MTAPDLSGIDLNLLVVLRALLAEQNVTRAAAKVGLSQSATSHALSRLRELYGDPLLVRNGRKLEPTSRAATLLPVLERTLSDLHRTIASPERFDPATARRVFRLGTTDYGQVVLGEPLLKRLAVEAPNVDVEFSGATHPIDLLDRGELDLTIGVHDASAMKSRHLTRILFEDDFVCMLRKGHPALESRLTLRRYLELRHVVVAPEGAPGSIVDSLLAERGITRRVAARIPSFLVAPIIVAGSNFINTGPALLARRLARSHPIVLVPTPLAVPRFAVRLVWPKRLDADPGHAWLRRLIIDAAERGPDPSRGRSSAA